MRVISQSLCKVWQMFNDDNLRHEIEHGDQSEYADLPQHAQCYRYYFILVHHKMNQLM